METNTNPTPTQQETLEPTLEELAEQSATLLMNLSAGADFQLREAKQIAFALRANIARRAAVAGPRGDVLTIAERVVAYLAGKYIDPETASMEVLPIAEVIAAAPADNDAEYGPSLVAFNLKTGVAYCPYCKTEFQRQSDGSYLTLHDCKGDR